MLTQIAFLVDIIAKIGDRLEYFYLVVLGNDPFEEDNVFIVNAHKLLRLLQSKNANWNWAPWQICSTDVGNQQT